MSLSVGQYSDDHTFSSDDNIHHHGKSPFTTQLTNNHETNISESHDAIDSSALDLQSLSRYTLCDLPCEIFDVIFFYLLPSPEERKERCFNDLFSFLQVNRTLRCKLKNNGYFWGSVFARFQVFLSCYLMDLPLLLPCAEKYSNFKDESITLQGDENDCSSNLSCYYSIHQQAAKAYIDWIHTFCDPLLIRKLEVPLPVDSNPQEIMNLWQHNLPNITHFLSFPVMPFPNDRYLQACNFVFNSLTHLDIFDGCVDIRPIIDTHPNVKSVTVDVPDEKTCTFLKSLADVCNNQLPNLQKVQLCVTHLQLSNDEIFNALLSLAPKLKYLNIYINSEEDISRWHIIAQKLQCLTHLYVRTAMNLQLVNDLFAKKYREEYCLFIVPSTIKQLGIQDQVNIGSFFEEVPVSVCLNGLNLPAMVHFDLQVSCLVGDYQLPFPKLHTLYFDSYGNSKMPSIFLFEFWVNQHQTLRTLLFNIISKPEDTWQDISSNEKVSTPSPTIVLKKKSRQMKSVNITMDDFEVMVEDCPRNLALGNVTKSASITGSNYVNSLVLNIGSHLESFTVQVNLKYCDQLKTSPPMNGAIQRIYGHYNSITIESPIASLAMLPCIQIMDMKEVETLSFHCTGYNENEDDIANTIREFISGFSTIKRLNVTSEHRTCETFNLNTETLNVEMCKQMFFSTPFGKENKFVTQLSNFGNRTESEVLVLPQLSNLKIASGSPLTLDRTTLSHLKYIDISYCHLAVKDESVVNLHWMPFLKHAIFTNMESMEICCSQEQEHHWLKYLKISQISKLHANISLRGPNLRVVCVTSSELTEDSLFRIVHAPKLVLSVLHIPEDNK
ncbi:hypothetical protein C9374_004438 [Naegleria lovaniensis]|uniref:Uncharacterized protein n=1 Tax=Naegleria lovaniensis TaxID=51637 RepID=A0AA88GLC2_NAELO|nr:uncharacterized protein C9374_004438 [Naegleria lovaniensis]KAG2383101.1 hypothetical protein C9374_004438 [Naegleria lovaniensis]